MSDTRDMESTILALGIVLGLVGWTVAFDRALPESSAPRLDVPGTYAQDFDPGEYHVYAESFEFSFSDLGGDIIVDDSGFDATDVAVINVETGQGLTVRQSTRVDPVGQGFTVYVPIASFDVVDDGSYDVDIAGGGVAIVAESFETSWREAIPWGIASLVGSVLPIAGFTMLVVGTIRRNKAKKNTQATSPQPPGAAPPSGAPSTPRVRGQASPSQPAPPPPGASPNR